MESCESATQIHSPISTDAETDSNLDLDFDIEVIGHTDSDSDPDGALETERDRSPHDPSWLCDDASCRACMPCSYQNSQLVADDTKKLCEDCKSYNWHKLFQHRFFFSHGILEADLVNFSGDHVTSKCPLCRLLASVTIPKMIKPLDARLYSISKDIPHGGEMKFFYVTGLEHGRDYVASDTPFLGYSTLKGRSKGFGVRAICPSFFNIQFAKDCINYCKENHQTSCKPTQNPAEEIFFRVIDCNTRTVTVAPPNCSYAALSYVWEKIPTGEAISTALDKCPKVISDSIEVALKLDLQYLWVDRYCIDQSSTQDKQDQIGHMDLIYANAQVTIIAAQSKVENAGLPGVTETRLNWPSVKFRGRIMAPTFLDSKGFVKKSKWVTRGWTYQERILSNRVLIFTDGQVFFECNDMKCAESLVVPFHLERVQRPTRPMTQVPPNIDRFMGFIYEFSTRKLTFQEDRLDAMKGIYRMLGKEWPPLYQFMGVPISISSSRYRPESYPIPRRTPEQGFLIGLTWTHDMDSKIERVAHFPSWSWAGWTGTISQRLIFDKDLEVKPENSLVFIELQDGSLRRFPSWKYLLRLISNPKFSKTKFIHIESETFLCSTILYKDAPHGFWTGGDLTSSTSGYHLLKMDSENGTGMFFEAQFNKRLEENEQSSKELTGIFLGNVKGIGPQPAAIIIVEELDGYFERVGVAKFDAHRSDLVGINTRHIDQKSLLLSAPSLKRRRIRIG